MKVASRLLRATHRDAQRFIDSYTGSALSDRGTLEDLSQSASSRLTHRRKLLILNGEMLERSIRHAWKTTPASRIE
jgi:hypothetical protein